MFIQNFAFIDETTPAAFNFHPYTVHKIFRLLFIAKNNKKKKDLFFMITEALIFLYYRIINFNRVIINKSNFIYMICF
jgi:hypothetical protein